MEINNYKLRIDEIIEKKNAFISKKTIIIDIKVFWISIIVILTLIASIIISFQENIVNETQNFFNILIFFTELISLATAIFVVISLNLTRKYNFNYRKVCSYSKKELLELYKKRSSILDYRIKNKIGHKIVILCLMNAINKYLLERYAVIPIINIALITITIVGFCYYGYKKISLDIKEDKIKALFYYCEKEIEKNKQLPSHCHFCGEKKINLMIDCPKCENHYI